MTTETGPNRMLDVDEVLALLRPSDPEVRVQGNLLVTSLSIREVAEAFEAAGHNFNRQGLLVFRR